VTLPACLLLALALLPARGNLLQNPGFEDPPSAGGAPPAWEPVGSGAPQITVSDREAHDGRQSAAIPAQSAVEQRVGNAEAGAYLFRCWVKSESEQPVTILLQDPDRPWEAYSCSEFKAPKNQWMQLEAFCALDRKGALKVTVGGMSDEFSLYHGLTGKMESPILLDACELIRSEPAPSSQVAVWDAGEPLSAMPDWQARSKWSPVGSQSHSFSGSPVFQARHLAGTVRQTDGGLVICAVDGQSLKARTIIAPSPAFAAPRCALVHSGERTGIVVASRDGKHAYTAWLTTQGLVSIEASNVPSFQARDCSLRYGILPSFVGSDICYDPRQMADGKQIALPSTQWFVGLVDGNESMLVAAWPSGDQAVSLGLGGGGGNRMFDSFSIATDKAGFSISFVEHPQLWHREPLQDDWLGEYTPISWQRPFPARWMGEFFDTDGGRPGFEGPFMQYSFPIPSVKTRMWGVWFDGWSHYPFYFDGPQTVFHFEKFYVPNGDALLYFLEPAAADLYSPCEILEQALGREKAESLWDLDASQLRKLAYSTPPEFMYDRPVCATTTHLSKIPRNEKAVVGVNLATHLFEFIREIRLRIDQYVTFFDRMQNYLDSEEKARPELHGYISDLRRVVSLGKSKSSVIYATPLAAVQAKTDAMKKLLLEGRGDGFDCGNLDVRGTAGDQDDICRHDNWLVLRLAQTAALKCGDSPEKARVARHVWEESRQVLRRPVRWEPRRSLYFFEP